MNTKQLENDIAVLYAHVNKRFNEVLDVNMSIVDALNHHSKILHRVSSLLEIVARMEVRQINTGITQMTLDEFMKAMNDKLTAEESAEANLVTVVSSLTAQVRANAADPVALQALLDRVDADTASIAAAGASGTTTPVTTPVVTSPVTPPTTPPATDPTVNPTPVTNPVTPPTNTTPATPDTATPTT